MHGHLNVKYIARRQISPWWWCNHTKLMESYTSPLGCAVSFQLHAGFRDSINFVRRLSFSSTGSVRVWFPYTDTVWIGTFYNFVYVIAVLFICCRYKCKSNLWKTYQQYFLFSFLTTNPNPKIRRSIQEAYHVCTRESQMQTLKVR